MARSDVLVSVDWTESNLDTPNIAFVLQELLGHRNVKNYDGSWTEYGSLVGAPIELGN